MRKSVKKEAFIYKPEYPGGMVALNNFISGQLRYPSKALDQKVEGTVRLRYDIDRNGKVLIAKVVSGIGHGCNEEAIRLVKLLKFEVDKNHVGGHLVFHQLINIHFKLPVVPTLQIEVPAAHTQENTQNGSPMQINYTLVAQAKVLVESENAVPEPPKEKAYHYSIKMG